MPLPLWAKPRFVFLAVPLYLAAHLAIRMAMGPGLSIDDTEQALLSQDYAWAYRFKAPPLFNWIMVTVGRLIPVDAFSIGLMRYALLGILYAFVYLAARRLLSDPRLSALSVYSFAAINPFAEASHRNLTHSTALTAVTAVTWYVFLRLAAAPRIGWYLALGAVFGLGLLAKWNFIILVLALPLACLLYPAGRRLVLTWKIVPAALLTAAIVMPTVIATLNIEVARSDDQVSTVLNTEAGRGAAQIVRGTLKLLDTAIIYGLPFLPIVAIIFALPLWRGLRSGVLGEASAPVHRNAALIGMTIAIGLASLWVAVLGAGATQFKVRYLYPILLILPVWAFMVIEAGRPSDRSLKLFALILMALVVFVAGKRLADVAGLVDCQICTERRPYDALAAQLTDAGYHGSGTILTDIETGGNMRRLFPHARMLDPTYPASAFPSASGEGQCLILTWYNGDQGVSAMESYLSATLHGDPGAPHADGTLTAPMLKPASGNFSLSYRLYEGPTGDCR